MMNPMQLISLLKNRNPQELAMSMIKNNNINDPMIQSAQNGDINNVNKIAESFCSQRGINFGQEFDSFMSMLK